MNFMAFGNELVITEESEVACRMGLACTGKEREISKRVGCIVVASVRRPVTREDHQRSPKKITNKLINRSLINQSCKIEKITLQISSKFHLKIVIFSQNFCYWYLEILWGQLRELVYMETEEASCPGDVAPSERERESGKRSALMNKLSEVSFMSKRPNKNYE